MAPSTVVFAAQVARVAAVATFASGCLVAPPLQGDVGPGLRYAERSDAPPTSSELVTHLRAGLEPQQLLDSGTRAPLRAGFGWTGDLHTALTPPVPSTHALYASLAYMPFVSGAPPERSDDGDDDEARPHPWTRRLVVELSPRWVVAPRLGAGAALRLSYETLGFLDQGGAREWVPCPRHPKKGECHDVVLAHGEGGVGVFAEIAAEEAGPYRFATATLGVSFRLPALVFYETSR